MKKSISALFLASVIMVTVNAAALPEVDVSSTINTAYEDREPDYAHIDTIDTVFYVSGTTATYCLDVEAISRVTKISATLQLQKRNSSGTYSNYGSSWSVSSSSSILSKSGTKTVASGGTYRYKATITTTTSSGSATETVYAS